jgi:hypothetical protein
LHSAYGCAQRQQIAFCTKTADLAFDNFGKHRLVAKLFTRVDIAHVQLDDGAGQHGQRIANAVAVVRPRTGVDQHRVGLVKKRFMNAVAHGAFVVGLKVLDAGAQLGAQLDQAGVDLVQRDGAVLRGVAFAKHIVVNTVEHDDFHKSTFRGGDSDIVLQTSCEEGSVPVDAMRANGDMHQVRCGCWFHTAGGSNCSMPLIQASKVVLTGVATPCCKPSCTTAPLM